MNFVRRLSRLGAFIAGLGILAMMLVGATDVLGLFLFNRPLPGAFEFTEALMVGSVFFAIAGAQANRSHVRVQVFVHLMPAWLGATLDRVGDFLTFCLFGLIAWIGWRMAAESIAVGEYSSGLIRFPVWPAKISLALGASLMTIQALFDTVFGSREAGEWSR